MSTQLLEVRALSKTFPGLRALDDVSFTVASGEVLAVVGQNGSGKSTLVKILAGVHDADAGGEINLGIGAELHFIHQDLGLIEMLSTVENLDLGRRLGPRGYLPAPVRRERADAERMIARFGASFDVMAPVGRLTAAERTIVAIARALGGWARPDNVLVLDEPTAALHGEEVRMLFEAVRRLAAEGAGIVFISHRLDEVMSLADRVMALRDGRVVADAARGEFDHDELVRMIAGRDVARLERPPDHDGDGIVFRARDIAGPTLRGVDLDIAAGEILGVTGLLGSGREELAAMLFGARPRQRGTVSVDGALVRPGRPRRSIARGVGYVPANRRLDGAIMTMVGRENLTLPRLAPLRSRFGALKLRSERAEARRWIETVDVRPPDAERRLEQFSGGNQQKLVLAKWLRIEPRVMLLDEPTQGVDVGAKGTIYELIRRAASRGTAILLSGSETKELTAMCHRVLVLRDGRVVAELRGDQIGEARLIRESLGLSGDEDYDFVGEASGEDRR